MKKNKAVNILLTACRKQGKFLLYGIIGCCCAGMDFAIYTLLCILGTNYLVANAIGIHWGIFCSFALNRRYTFKVSDKPILRFFSFYIIGLTGLALSSGILFLMVTICRNNAIFAKLVAIFVVAVIQFFLNKFITFRKGESCK
ncbi:MAG: GtrA family protein [Prevotellaceae bacterium]|nr:GtrA family protein [Prevotellaceae bacterium]